MMGDALPALRRQLNIRIGPEVIFDGKVQWEMVNLDKIILAMSHSKNEISVKECSENKIASRMINSNLHELDSFYNYYSTFKFAFPGLSNNFLERVPEIYNNLLSKALSGIESYKVLHPYPVSFEKLYRAMEPIFQTRKNSTNKEE
ncbi:MAG: hypothetical protein IH819_08800, partial [Bacteroidetes bacterium]|nr:hypothetical protein [Bacteroidota bacterium]